MIMGVISRRRFIIASTATAGTLTSIPFIVKEIGNSNNYGNSITQIQSSTTSSTPVQSSTFALTPSQSSSTQSSSQSSSSLYTAYFPLVKLI